MNRQNADPTLNDILDARIQIAMAAMNCIGIGTIQAFDSDYQMATISINYKRVQKNAAVAENNIDTVDVIKGYPLLLKCPVIFLGGGVSRLTLPVTTGDPCLVFFADRDIDTWVETGITSNPPNSERMHSLTDAIALVGIRPNSAPLTSFDTVKASLIDIHGERLAQSGDMKPSMRTANHSGWLIMKGDSIGKSGSGATYTGELYRELFDIIKSAYPNAGTEDFDTGNKVYIPDMRGRNTVGADNMGGSAANVLTSGFTTNRNTLGGLIGEESHLLTGQESGIQQHNHTMPGAVVTGQNNSIVSQGNAYDYGYVNSTNNTGHTDAINRHNNVQPGTIVYWFIKI